MTTFITKGTMSSEKDDWGTPRLLFSILDGIFHFTLDPCSSDGNNLCEKHYTREDSGLEHSWQGETVFMNPPYGKDIGLWTSKALAESRRGGCLVVGLVPARTDTKWWHDSIQDKADVIFIKGRLKYGDGDQAAPFPSALVFWYGQSMLMAGEYR